ncbi:RusA family crossover junction endodeoxyribonuclease [Streptomyces bluensis]|uniref:RusA-like resolvase n=1 Tax=Streptomyces bluensis TaxID=33897 RepID=A0ABW6UW14_9ACTN
MTMTAPDPTALSIPRPPSWRVELPVGTFLLNDNQRLHHRRKAEYIELIRRASGFAARAAKTPTFQRIHVFYVVHPKPDLRRRDPGNWSPTAKAAIDGLVDAGVVPDDNSDRVLGGDPRIGHPVKGSQFVLWITDLDQMHPDHIALLNPPGATR